MSGLILYHGSSEIVERPEYGRGKEYNDYGRGFYCTEHRELAKEWACTEGRDGFVNQFVLDLEGLRELNLSAKESSTLHWLALLVMHRKLRLATPLMRRSVRWLKEHFAINVNEFDVIRGYRADDSYFSFARAFLNNEITLGQLEYAMHLGKLGEQVVIKSEKAFSQLRFLDYEAVDNKQYYPKRKRRDEQARVAYLEELEREEVQGVYIRDLMHKEGETDVARL